MFCHYMHYLGTMHSCIVALQCDRIFIFHIKVSLGWALVIPEKCILFIINSAKTKSIIDSTQWVLSLNFYVSKQPLKTKIHGVNRFCLMTSSMNFPMSENNRSDNIVILLLMLLFVFTSNCGKIACAVNFPISENNRNDCNFEYKFLVSRLLFFNI